MSSQPPPSSSTDYLFVFAEAHNEFRVPELRSIAELHGFSIHIKYPWDSQSSDNREGNAVHQFVNGPFMVIALESEAHARTLASRCILIRSIWEFWARGSSYDELHANNLTAKPKWERYVANTSFKFLVAGHNRSISQRRQREIMESFSYMDFLGLIELKSPEIVLGYFEEYVSDRGKLVEDRNKDGEFIQAYFGRLIVEGTARALIGKFDVKKREYFGNTSMEAEISLLMANQTLASPGKIVYDPFMGTGSMAYTTAHFGAYVFGSDIDGRQMRGKAQTPGVLRSARQYGVADRILGLCTFDVTRNPWRTGGLFDAIVTDPPYGVRAGAKRLGRKTNREDKHTFVGPRAADEPYIPPTKPYELSALASDLVRLARYLLKPGGRLVFFLPTVTDEYRPVDIESMMCDGMELVANSLQDFGSWGRRLITIKKMTSEEYGPPSFDSEERDAASAGGEEEGGDENAPAHKNFREKYFQAFMKKQ
ncbi:RNA methylase [Coniophora puteana RWD-64-598 SS2]|uniref:tRNA (guanine(10)-N(2))-methyltransferase n=1 Tax=Coniophora puteana (strain RWD-64-598) TaxID=741705 RepID=A0A5M3MVP7_CONPW|nr:RNA methylase [Coniophora puteana RWD-64-598 SS2]EIW82661.1 RNA methylase [Coniophora puteana RWD-64-598 SS2]